MGNAQKEKDKKKIPCKLPKGSLQGRGEDRNDNPKAACKGGGKIEMIINIFNKNLLNFTRCGFAFGHAQRAPALAQYCHLCLTHHLVANLEPVLLPAVRCLPAIR